MRTLMRRTGCADLHFSRRALMTRAGQQMLAIPETLDPRTHEAGDRYLVYHGTPSERNWAGPCSVTRSN